MIYINLNIMMRLQTFQLILLNSITYLQLTLLSSRFSVFPLALGLLSIRADTKMTTVQSRQFQLLHGPLNLNTSFLKVFFAFFLILNEAKNTLRNYWY